MRAIFILFALLAYQESFAAISNFPGSTSSGYDEFTVNGLRCRNAVGGRYRFEAGVIDEEIRSNNALDREDIGATYARFVFPFGFKQPKRFDCSRLFDLEMRKQELQIEQLERELYMVEDD